MIQISKIPYGGWQNCYKVSSSFLELIVTSDVGPRIISFGFPGQENQFHEKKEEAGITGGSDWHAFGGHRLWHAPEDPVRTYSPDNQPVEVEKIAGGVQVIQTVEPTGIQKTLEITLSDTEACVKVNHILTNLGVWTVPLAAWALSVMKAGGMAVIPHPAKIDFPACLTPTHSLSLWGYTKMNDPRWTWGEKYFLLRQDSAAEKPQKIGCMNTSGWAAYLRNGNAFVKQFDCFTDASYPDFNCNFETFTDASMLEMETLSPLVHLEPGKKIEHLETWSLHKNVQTPASDADVDRFLLPLIKNQS